MCSNELSLIQCKKKLLPFPVGYVLNFILFCCFVANGIIKSLKVVDAMESIDRGFYCRNNPYMDSPQGIGYAVTISAPHMVMIMIRPSSTCLAVLPVINEMCSSVLQLKRCSV